MNDLRSVVAALALAACAETPETAAVAEAPEIVAAVSTGSSPPAASAPKPPLPDASWIHDTLDDTPVGPWLAKAEAHRVQILVRTSGGAEHGFRVDAEYVYPASAIKTLLSVAALRAVRERRADFDHHPLAEIIDRLQRRSDNRAFGQLYDVVGHRELNETWHGLGFTSVRFHHRMGGTREEGLHTEAVSLSFDGHRVAIPKRDSDLVLAPTPASRLSVGKKHQLRDGTVRDEPMSFADKNYVSLRELQRVNVSLVEPHAAGAVDLGLAPADRALLLAAMSDTTTDVEQHKPLLSGVHRAVKHVRHVGKSGRAYGFHLANAYIENLDNQRAFYVTASIYANPNETMNDDAYDYEGATQPFMIALGEALAGALLR